MKIQEVILRAVAKKITWTEAGKIIGLCERQMRRWKQHYQEFGYDGLCDRRLGKPNPERVPWATVEEVLGLYQEKYADLTTFSGKAERKTPHPAELHLGEARLTDGRTSEKEPQAGSASTATSTPALPGMLLHLDGSSHAWFQDDRRYDLPGASGRCHMRDLLHAAGGRGVDGYDDDRTARGDRAERSLLRALQRSGQSFFPYRKPVSRWIAGDRHRWGGRWGSWGSR
jgi:hypothetical protein